VTGPLGDPVEAAFALLGDGRTAVIEMAAASGMGRLPAGRRDPRRATTRGTGELVRAALDLGLRRIVVGLGGSATVDGGAGFAQALGARLLDGEGRELPVGAGGASLARLERIDVARIDPRLAACEVIGLSDVDNPLLGPEGAAAIFGPQKGADPPAVAELEAALARWAACLARDAGTDVGERRGTGAAGGLGAALVAFCRAELPSGAGWVMEAVGFGGRLGKADLVVTGEGRIDGQTGRGKLPLAVARAAAAAGRPCVALAGELGRDLPKDLAAALPLVPGPLTAAEAIAGAADLLERAAERAGRLILAGRGI
jgi:glycerate kinase